MESDALRKAFSMGREHKGARRLSRSGQAAATLGPSSLAALQELGLPGIRRRRMESDTLTRKACCMGGDHEGAWA